MTLDQLLGNDLKLFAKSEFGPAHSDWPALSFSSNKIEYALEQRVGINPLRTGSNYSDVYAALAQRWSKQKGRCALCGESIPLGAKNKLVKMSRDPTDSANKEYCFDNVQITHYGCNLAKSDATMEEWREYRAMLGNRQGQ